MKCSHAKAYVRDKETIDTRGMAKNLAKLYEASSIDEKIKMMRRIFCNHTYVNDEYLEIQQWAITERIALLKEMAKELDPEKIPMYVKTNWGDCGTMYGKIDGFTLSHWMTPFLGRHKVSLFVTFKTIRQDGRRQGGQWIWDCNDNENDLLTPISKKEYKAQPLIDLSI
jgi:hypothetical protein